MTQRYPFYDLKKFTWITNLVSIIPGTLCIVGIIHGIGTWQALAVMDALSPLTALPDDVSARLLIDTHVREAQVVSTLVLVLFYTYWVYFSARNMLVLFEKHTASTWQSIKLFFGLFAQLHKITRLIDSMRYQSIPPGHEHEPVKWLLPVWSLSLVSANVCKLTAVYLMVDALSVADFRSVALWAFAAYVLYLIFYAVTARITFEVVWLQNLSHEHRRTVLTQTSIDSSF
ncbi:MAG: hypothetical protein COA68_07315 [Oceanobacter sp.]|jgi:hypothetical protein|nr:MAG: hypothetical protein COA68_07315 [Oceanobacter sp.]|tara:strand:+ start:5123 stop:5812 length:690 start_codon:yes stop_codon:yes gene_type:complete